MPPRSKVATRSFELCHTTGTSTVSPSALTVVAVSVSRLPRSTAAALSSIMTPASWMPVGGLNGVSRHASAPATIAKEILAIERSRDTRDRGRIARIGAMYGRDIELRLGEWPRRDDERR